MDRQEPSTAPLSTLRVVGGVLLVVFVCVSVLWSSWEEDLEEAEWKKGDQLDVVLACPPSYKVAMLALLKSLNENSEPASTRVWIFQDSGDNVEQEVKEILRSNDVFPAKNVWFVNYTQNDYLGSLLEKIEEDFDATEAAAAIAAKPVHTPQNTRFSSQRPTPPHTPPHPTPSEVEHHRNHLLLVDQHNYIRFYIPSIFKDLPSSHPGAYPSTPKQFLYLDCDMIALRDPIILMNKIAPHLGERGREKEEEEEREGEGEEGGKMCLAAAEREDPLLFDSLGRGDEAEKIIKELGIDSQLKSFNAGMLVIDTDCWIETQALERILFWMELRTTRAVYSKGSQPPLLLSFIPEGSSVINPSELYPRPMEYFVVGDEWDFQARNLDPWQRKVGIVHYNGKNKPWQFIVRDEYQQETWEKYSLPSLLPPDRPPTDPDETSQQKAERREGELKRELERIKKELEKKKEREEKERIKEEKEKMKEEKEQRKEEDRWERAKEREREREERKRKREEEKEEGKRLLASKKEELKREKDLNRRAEQQRKKEAEKEARQRRRSQREWSRNEEKERWWAILKVERERKMEKGERRREERRVFQEVRGERQARVSFGWV